MPMTTTTTTTDWSLFASLFALYPYLYEGASYRFVERVQNVGVLADSRFHSEVFGVDVGGNCDAMDAGKPQGASSLNIDRV